MKLPTSVPFVILSAPRSGSTWLVDQLHRPPRIRCYSEMFINGGPDDKSRPSAAGASDLLLWHAYEREHKKSGSRSSPILLRRYLRQIYASSDVAMAVGMKVMYADIRAKPFLLPLLRTWGVGVIHLRRANLLEVAISQSRRVARGGASHAAANTPLPESSAMTIDPAQLLDYLETLASRQEQMARLLGLMRFRTVEVTYEELTNGHSWERLSSLLGARRITPRKSALQKLSVKSPPEQVANWDEVVSVLAKTRFAAFTQAD